MSKVKRVKKGKTVVKTKKTSPKEKDKKKKGYKRGSLMKSIYDYFDEVGVDSAKYEATEKLAKKIMPSTKFNKAHFSWYKNDYRNKQEE